MNERIHRCCFITDFTNDGTQTVLISLIIIILIIYICLGDFFPLLFNGCSGIQSCQNLVVYSILFPFLFCNACNNSAFIYLLHACYCSCCKLFISAFFFTFFGPRIFNQTPKPVLLRYETFLFVDVGKAMLHLSQSHSFQCANTHFSQSIQQLTNKIKSHYSFLLFKKHFTQI